MDRLQAFAPACAPPAADGRGVAARAVTAMAAMPRDRVQIASPFLGEARASSPFRAPAAAPLPIDAGDEAHPTGHLTVFQKAAMAGLGGLAVMGTLMTAGTSVAAAATLPEESSIAQTVVRRQAGRQANPAMLRQGTRLERDTTEHPEQPVAGHHVRVFGQDLGDVGDEVPGVKWDTYKGTQNGVGYSVEYPTGWKVTHIFNGVAVLNPKQPTTVVVFQWRSGQGYMNPQGLINTLLQEAQASNLQVHTTKPSGPHMTPVGPLYVTEEDVSYTADGNRLRAGFTSAVAQAPSSYVPFWTGNLVVGQSAERDFQKELPIMRHIGNSFTQN